MVAIAYSVAFEGVEARLVEVQCSVSPGLPGFSIVGLPDKAVSEARERVRAAFDALSVALPSRRITVNLSPADLPKEGSHFDLPIALAVLAMLALQHLPAGLNSLIVWCGYLLAILMTALRSRAHAEAIRVTFDPAQLAYGDLLEKDARKAIEKAVWGMLPKNRLGRQQLKKLKVYSGPEHPHSAQQAKPYEITQISQGR